MNSRVRHLEVATLLWVFKGKYKWRKLGSVSGTQFATSKNLVVVCVCVVKALKKSNQKCNGKMISIFSILQEKGGNQRNQTPNRVFKNFYVTTSIKKHTQFVETSMCVKSKIAVGTN